MPHPRNPRTSRRLLVIGAGLCVLVIVVAVVGLAGGLEPVPAQELPVVAVSERNEGQPWNVTVTGAVLATDLEPAVLQADGYWLAVIAEVEITADESRNDMSDILYVTDLQGLAREYVVAGPHPGAVPADDVRLVRDASVAFEIHPGLPERLAFLWELARDTPPPAEVHVEIAGKTYRKDSLSGLMQWLDEAPRAQLTVPVEDRREQP